MDGDRPGPAHAAGGAVSEALAPVLRQINAAHGTAFALGERFRWGEQGAVGLRDAAGAGFVLKWKPGAADLGRLPAERPVLDRLRAAGYPIPRYVAWGVLAAPAGRYTVQERLPGASAWGLRGAALEDALALNDLQAGAGGAAPTGRGVRPRRLRQQRQRRLPGLLIALYLWLDWRRRARLSPAERERRAWELEAYRRQRPRIKAGQRAREERIREVAEGVRRGMGGW